jgi:membrane-bound lytic murein transglycosylase D
LMGAPGGARAAVRIAITFDRLVDQIAALDVLALRDADGVTESRSEPAAIDEVLTAATFERALPKATTAETVASDLELEPTDVPIAQNEKVLSYIELYQGRLRDSIQAALDRSQRYLPMIQSVFEEEGLPLELSYIPLVESAFKANAVSRASARGMWQFMLGTAREHGLKQDWFIDERSDPEKATRAAAQYLKTLNEMFDGDWTFALASYNAGPGRLQRAARLAKSSDFWKISASTRYLPRETREYVPMIMAAILVARNPQLYGFEVASSAPLVYDTVTIPGAIDLKLIAEWGNVSVEELRDLNPELRRTTTPMAEHDLKVPVGTAAPIQAGLQSADPVFRTFMFYTVKRGDTLSAIARRYGITVRDIQEANKLTSTRLSIRQQLAIPTAFAPALPEALAPTPTVAAGAGGPRAYRVQRGDTLIGIARQFSTTVTALKQLNGLTSDRIKVGDVLTVRR